MCKSLFVMAVVSVFLASSMLQAAQADNLGPAIIKLKMGKKTFEFTHKKHQKLTGDKCWECHDKKNGKIDNWGEKTAHKLCIPCHDLQQKGPVSCKGCHKK